MRSRPSLPETVSRLRGLPFTVALNSGLTWLRSRSLASLGPNWLVPQKLARFDVERHRRIGVQIRAGAHVRIKVGRRIPDRHVEHPVLDVERQRRPQAAAAVLARGLVGPGLRSGLARVGNEIEAPDLLTGGKLEGADPVLRPPVRAGRAVDHQVLVDQRRHAQVLAGLRIGDLLAPEQRALGHVERDQVAVRGAANEASVLQRHAAIGGRKSRTLLLPVVSPALSAGRRVDRDGRLVDGQIHHALVDERVGLRGAGDVRAEDANGAQLAGVLGRDLRELDEALTGVVLARIEPVLLVLRRVQQFGLRRTLSRGRSRGRRT